MARRYLTEIHLTKDTPQYDAIVIGGGVSGLYLAARLPRHFKVLLLSKDSLSTCNSQLAQGGVALTLNGEINSHVEDTLEAGAHLNDLRVVKAMVSESQTVLNHLLEYGVEFDRDDGNQLSMTREGGHRKKRILHARDATGMALMDALIRQIKGLNNVHVKEYAFAVDLITEDQQMLGISYHLENAVHYAVSKVVILATGGIGGWFSRTTNAPVVTGDGLAMALRAGALLRDAAYIQYHPTAFKLRTGGYYLISEAVRGEGGVLINDKGERFMNTVHPLMELAPRDVVSKAIHDQLCGGRRVFVDVRHFSPEFFRERFPNIYKMCMDNGVDPEAMPIPVEPVEHYHMGGVMADDNGATSITGLFVTGEAAGTGFHGANRLASNSLLECMALSERIVRVLSEKEMGYKIENDYHVCPLTSGIFDSQRLNRHWLKSIFDTAMPLVKCEQVLLSTLSVIKDAFEEIKDAPLSSAEAFEVYNGLQVAKALIMDALTIKKSVGSFVISDNGQVPLNV